MNFPPNVKPEKNAYLQLLMLAVYALAGVIVFTALGFVILYIMYGSKVFGPNALMGGNPEYLNGLKIIQIFTSIGFFLAPPLLLAFENGRRIKDFYGFGKPKAELIFLVFLIMLCSMPFMEWTAMTNQKMVLPDFLKPVDTWMRNKEEELMRMTLILLKINTTWDFLVNLFMIALVPAVAEELMFRGGVQRGLNRMFNNPHVAIWFAAFIFSAIHMQFFGFLPRLLLGAGFGYIYYWSGSLWYAMLGHFINNGYAVCVAWYLQIKHLPLEDADNTFHFKWYGYVLSLLVTIALFIYFKKRTIYGKQLG
ncbi:CPBP family intramembrane metalloprotease domain-containing protein [Pedobacter sp. HMWF019]|uniref:CPBP family intramembrane glutamic endopeptidase n=1 Tax=Pedobacter sp. HMWF019 TaxID=2056856 RepID=UPI000D3D63F7|nr:CPBP family intramembrane glutamic endopeptidase [Pedobacter sp. HMWF019]PTT01156.1 CPBP family intramembrane metalloprotease domain-containing protein [Pedobacter sp. HMWF019]